MTTVCVVQARTGSSRLPGKVLAPLGDTSVLGLLLTRLATLRVDALVVATTTEPTDDAVVEVAKSLGIEAVRGPGLDVLERFRLAAEAHHADVVVRLTADCPLIDPRLVEQVVAALAEQRADYASNTLVRTYPDGLDVEALTRDALDTAAREARDGAEREHVTPFVYRRPERFRLIAVTAPQDHAHERWTLDTPDDLERLRGMVAALADPANAPWERILASVGATPPARRRLRTARSDDGIPPTIPLDDPGARVWVLDDGGPAAWVRVTVQAGVGVLEYGSLRLHPEGTDPQIALDLLLDRIDQQVVELRATERGGEVLWRRPWSSQPRG